MKHFLKLAFCFSFVLIFNSGMAAEPASVYANDFTFKTLIGDKPLLMSELRGKVVLVVNTASNCGYTGQYEGLEALYKKHKDDGLVILGIPSNDFGRQEPGNNQEIAQFCRLNYGVSFPMTSKEVVSGNGAHPFYKWAKNSLGAGSVPKWNFHKYLLDRDGKLIGSFRSAIAPDSKELVNAVNLALKTKS